MKYNIVSRMQLIDSLLRKQKYVTTKQIQDITELKNRKTIYKTIDYMRDIWDAPIVYNKQDRSYYYSQEDYRLQSFYVTGSDLFALLIADKALEQYKNTPFYGQLRKIFLRIKDMLPDKIKINPDELSDAVHFQLEGFTNYSKEIFDAVTKSINESWELEIKYSAITSEETITRTIQPYFIFTKHGDWYIYAFCKIRSDFRLFALHRIKKAKLTDEVFLRQEDIKPKEIMGEYFDQPTGKGKYDIEIFVKYPTSLYVKERQLHSSQKIEEYNDGSIKISFTVNSLKETQRWILSMGSDAIVKKPTLLKNIIREEIGLLMENYSK